MITLRDFQNPRYCPVFYGFYQIFGWSIVHFFGIVLFSNIWLQNSSQFCSLKIVFLIGETPAPFLCTKFICLISLLSIKEIHVTQLQHKTKFVNFYNSMENCSFFACKCFDIKYHNRLSSKLFDSTAHTSFCRQFVCFRQF